MRWKQFFTPVNAIDTGQARAMMQLNPGQAMTILDVRQPNEYEAGHIPGAKLIPLPDLSDRLAEQALDLYQRAADSVGDEKSAAVLLRIAGEETAHLAQLGKLMEDVG